MKIKKLVSIIFIITMIVCNGSVTVFAIDTGFSTSEMSIKDQQTFISNTKLSLINDEPRKSIIKCFDVSNSELIAIGSKISEKAYISVYDTTGKFQYGYAFDCNQNFAVQWDDTNLIIYFVRSDVAALVDSNGTIMELKRIDNTLNNNSYWHHSVFITEKTLNDNRYTIKNNMGLLNVFVSTYSLLVKTDSDGNETIIYDVSSAQTAKTVFIFIGVCLFASIVIYGVVGDILKAKRQNK